MYFFRKKSANGETLQLLESYRNGDGQPRTRVVVSLGDIDYDKDLRSALAVEIEGRLYSQQSLLEPSKEVAELADRIVRLVHERGRWGPHCKHRVETGEHKAQMASKTIDGVLLDKVETENSVSLGPELVALHAWESLRMSECLATRGFNPAQQRAACAQVVGRLVDPGSELALSNLVLPGSALSELIGERDSQTKTSIDRLYRVSDKLVASREKIEAHLRKATTKQLNLTRTYYLYDLTNSHFEGICAANPKAKRGNSKQKRNDCPLITAGVCFDEHGFVLFHKTFAGNVGEASTLPEMIELMRECIEPSDSLFDSAPTVLLDGGLATPDNLEALRKAGIGYLVNRTRSYRSTFQAEFAQVGTFEDVPDRIASKRVQVRTAELPEGDAHAKDTIVLCRSNSRASKESAIRSKAENKLLADLEKLRNRIASKRLKQADKIQQAVGRLRERHPKVARYYDIELKDGHLDWTRCDTIDDAESLDGCYILQTSLQGLTAPELWQRYVVLSKAEAGFRCIKHECGMRPNFHRLERRVDGHIFISILAYQLMRFVCYQLEASGDTRSWATLRRVLQTHRYNTTILPTAGGDVWRLRKAGRPEAVHRSIYSTLGIDYLDLPTTQTLVPTKQKTNRNV